MVETPPASYELLLIDLIARLRAPASLQLSWSIYFKTAKPTFYYAQDKSCNIHKLGGKVFQIYPYPDTIFKLSDKFK